MKKLVTLLGYLAPISLFGFGCYLGIWWSLASLTVVLGLVFWTWVERV